MRSPPVDQLRPSEACLAARWASSRSLVRAGGGPRRMRSSCTRAKRSIRALLERVGRRGRNGAGVLRTVIDERVPGHAVPESPMETRLLWLLRQLGFPAPVPQYEVWVQGQFYGRLDAAYPDERVGVEYQSYEHHAGKLSVDRDNARRRRFTSINWDVIEVTAADLR